jgi:hypothetical protein
MLGFGPWRPDVGGPNSGFAEVATGCVPQTGGYGPFPQLVTASGAEALSGAPRGGVSAQLFGGSWAVFFATATTIERMDSAYQFSDVETGRTITADDDVAFLPFGAFLLNTDTTSGLKAYNMETPAGNNAVSGAPAARALFSCNNVVFLLDCAGNNRRMQSSAVGNHTLWTGEGTDGKTFEDGGALICGRDLKNGTALIAQERALRLLQFGQGAGLYSIAKLADGRGCVADRTMVAFDGAAFWWDIDGPWQFTTGGGLIPIGAEKINRWAEVNIGSANYKNLQGAVDPSRNLVVWRVDATYGLAYNWLLKDFSIIPMQTSALARIATPGITIDSVTDPIDDVAIAWDSRVWAGGSPVLGALDVNRKFATFSGGNMAATLRTCRLNGPGLRHYSWATPIDDAADSTLRVGVADSPAASITWKEAKSKVRRGRVPLRAEGMNAQFELSIPLGSNWTFANGLDHIE